MINNIHVLQLQSVGNDIVLFHCTAVIFKVYGR